MSSNSSIFEGIEDYLQPVYDVSRGGTEALLTLHLNSADPLQNKQGNARPLTPINQKPTIALTLSLAAGVPQDFEYQAVSTAWLTALTYIICVVAGPAAAVFTVQIIGRVPGKPDVPLSTDNFNVAANNAQQLVNYYGTNLLLNRDSKIIVRITSDIAGSVIRALPANDSYNLLRLNFQQHINNADFAFGTLRVG